jgi:hypothetical protein
MIATQLSSELEQRAGAFLAAAQFAADAGQARAATIVGAAARIARPHGVAGVEGYLAAVGDIGSDADGIARAAIRSALDATIVSIAADAWLGRLPSSSERGEAADLPTAA